MSAVNSDVLRAIATLNEAAFSISLILSGYLLGIVTIQVYIYYTTFPDDPKFLKCAVALICVLDLAQFVACADFTWWYVVTDWGNTPSLFGTRTSFGLQVILGVSVVTIVELMFLRRIWILSRRLLLIIPVLVLVAVQYTFAIIASALLLRISSDHIFPFYSAAVVTWLGAGLAADCSISAILCTYLLCKRTSCERIDGTMKKIVFYTINTCLLTSMVSLANVITFFVMSENTINVGLNMLLCRLFSNSFMASLNQRSTLREITDKYIRYPGSMTQSEQPAFPLSAISITRRLKSGGEDPENPRHVHPMMSPSSQSNEVFMDLRRESISEPAFRAE